MKRSSTGHFLPITVGDQRVQSFIPLALPPTPGIDWTAALTLLFEEAMLALGRLESTYALVPMAQRLQAHLEKKEALASCVLEGAQVSLRDVFLQEVGLAGETPKDEVMRVLLAYEAMQHGWDRLEEGLPLSLRFIRSLHFQLFKSVKHVRGRPGEFRNVQNWVGDARPQHATYVPTPVDAMLETLIEFERFMVSHPQPIFTLARAGLAHVQFATILPFEEGNGIVGRMLISHILRDHKILARPTLMPSVYILQHRETYYQLIRCVHEMGDWELWLAYFAKMIRAGAEHWIESVLRISRLIESDRLLIETQSSTPASVMSVLDVMIDHPIITGTMLSDVTQMTPTTINRILTRLMELGIIEEVSGKKRNRLYVYKALMDTLSDGLPTEPVDMRYKTYSEVAR